MTTEILNKAKTLEFDIRTIENVLKIFHDSKNLCHFDIDYYRDGEIKPVGETNIINLPISLNEMFVSVMEGELKRIKKEFENL